MPPMQLRMFRPNLDALPPIALPPGYELRTYRDGDDVTWAAIAAGSLNPSYTPEKAREGMIKKPQFKPERMFFVTHQGQAVGTATAWMNPPTDTQQGYVHMVGVLEAHRGKGLGRVVTLAVLHYFRDHGFTRAILDTDDWRVPALVTYLKLGFRPLYRDDTHPARWKALREKFGPQLLPNPLGVPHIERERDFVVGDSQAWRIVYEAGDLGLAQGGGLRITLPAQLRPQIASPSQPNFVSASQQVRLALESSPAPTAGSVLCARIEGRPLPPGGTLEVVFGQRQGESGGFGIGGPETNEAVIRVEVDFTGGSPFDLLATYQMAVKTT